MKTERLNIRLEPEIKKLLQERSTNISKYLIDNFLELPIYEFNKLPDKQGIYFVISGTRLLYIGQSKDVRHRIQTHHRRGQFLAFKVKVLFFETIDVKIETDFILYFDPILNGTKSLGSNKIMLQIRKADRDIYTKLKKFNFSKFVSEMLHAHAREWMNKELDTLKDTTD